jgi:hypothetical protein
MRELSLEILHICLNFDAIPDLADLAAARKNDDFGRLTV